MEWTHNRVDKQWSRYTMEWTYDGVYSSLRIECTYREKTLNIVEYFVMGKVIGVVRVEFFEQKTRKLI